MNLANGSSRIAFFVHPHFYMGEDREEKEEVHNPYIKEWLYPSEIDRVVPFY